MLRIVCLYLKWIIAAPRDPAGASDEKIAGWCLLHKQSFRLPAMAANDRFIGLRQWKRAMASRPAVPLPVVANEVNGPVSWVFDNRAVTKELRVEHVAVSIKKEISFFASRDQVTGLPGCAKFTDKIILSLLLPFLCCWSFFSSRRVSIALLFTEMREAAGMIRLARKMNVKIIYFYCPFEKDANALYLLFRREGIEVAKIPSPSLLAIHHVQLLSDTLVLTSPYQEDELAVFSKTIRVKRIEKWVPEIFLTYGHRYDTWIPTDKGTVGFYSHATWLRIEQDKGSSGEGDLDAEIKLLPILAQVLKKHPEFKLVLFLHPKEKRYEPQEKVRDFYAKQFDGINFSFADGSIGSTMQFERAETGIGAISTILFERIFSGYKTIMYPVGVNGFPVAGSNFKRACALNPEELEAYLLEAFSADEETYFNRTGLLKYTRKGWMNTDV